MFVASSLSTVAADLRRRAMPVPAKRSSTAPEAAMPEAGATRAADYQRRGKDCQPSPRSAPMMAGEQANTALAALSAIGDGDRMPGHGENRLKRGRAVRQSSTTRLAAERDNNLGTGFRRLPGSGRRLGTQENAEKLTERAGAQARDARRFSGR